MKNKKLIIIPFGFPSNWPCDYETQTATHLANKNTVIAFLTRESVSCKKFLCGLFKKRFININKKNINLTFISPVNLIPFPKTKQLQKLNYYLNILQLKLFSILLKKKNTKKYLWIFPSQIEFPYQLFRRNFILIYDCVDQPSSIISDIKKKEQNLEKKVIENSKIVFTNSKTLYNLKRKFHSKVYLVPQGFDEKLFKTFKDTEPKDLRKFPKPRIGYIGNINYRLDFSLIWKTALSCPNFSFVFIGPRAPEPIQDKIVNTENWLKKLSELKNVYFLGLKDKKKIPVYIKYLDICIIPYNIKYLFNKYCFPMKLLEYFYLKKPVVSTPIEELKYYKKYVKLCNTPVLFKKSLETIYSKGLLLSCKKNEREIAIQNSWKNKVNLMLNIINQYG